MKPFKKRLRIYIFPNRFGFVGFALFLIMLAAGATYQNNLVFMMAFLAISLGLVAILQTARNLRDIEVVALNVDSHFVNRSTDMWLSLINRSGDPKINLEIRAEFRQLNGSNSSKKKLTYIYFDVTAIDKASTEAFRALTQLPPLRGHYRLHRLQLSTTAPYGLFRAWIYLSLATEFFVYPEPIGQKDLPISPTVNGEDFSGHRSYRQGDNVSRIDWRVYSRRKKLYIKEFLDGARPKVDFEIINKKEPSIEPQLSQLSLWLSEAFKKDIEFRLTTSNFKSPYAHDRSHYQRCMAELAKWPA